MFVFTLSHQLSVERMFTIVICELKVLKLVVRILPIYLVINVMTSTEDNVLYREATADDKTAVIDIRRNVYDGIDYLEAYYDAFMAAETITCYVAIFQKQVVGFCAAMLLDGGKTFSPRAARVSPMVEGTGVYFALKNYAARQSGAKREALTASDINPNIRKESFKNAYKFVLTRKFIRYKIDADVLKSLQIPKLTGPVRQIDRQAFTEYMTTPVTSGYLFPAGRVIIDWVPFRLLPENFPVLESFEGNKCRIFSSMTPITPTNGLVTINTMYKTSQLKYHCNIDIYGTKVDSLKDHMLQNLTQIKEADCDTTSLIVYTPMDFDTEYLDKLFIEFGLPRNDWIFESLPSENVLELYLYEKSII
ncbi:histidine N-acetyltransferase-like isoform X1 [Mya arenaria]|nr:histidine N-acetyltransferase-like isoform X1 [Mya arenaria]